MALPRKKYRELLFQLLYSNHFYAIDGDDFIGFMMNILKTTKKNVSLARESLKDVLQHLPNIDAAIENAADDYQFSRISKVELNVLRLAIYEMIYDEMVPPKVAIAEGLRLCKKFGSAQSTKFVNSILDIEHKRLLVNESSN